jgi:hypothetical protein
MEGQEQPKKSEAISSVVNTVDLDYFTTTGTRSSLVARSLSVVAEIQNINRKTYWMDQGPACESGALPLAA